MKRYVCALVMSCVLATSASAFVVPVKRTDSWCEIKQIAQQALQGEFTKFASSIQGLGALQNLRSLVSQFEDLKKMFDQFQNFSFDFDKVLDGLMKDMQNQVFESKSVSSATAKSFSEKAFRKASGEMAEDVKKQIGGMISGIGRGAGNAGGLLGGLTGDSKSHSTAASKKVMEEMAEHYFASYPGVQEEAFRRIYQSSTSPAESGIGARAFGEEVRARASARGTKLRAPYIKDDSGKNEYDKKTEKVMEEEKKVSERLQKDISNSGNELEVLRNIASMTAALVERQGNTNVLLAIQIEQANDRAEMLSHTAAMLAELYGKSVESGIRRQVDDLAEETRSVRYR